MDTNTELPQETSKKNGIAIIVFILLLVAVMLAVVNSRTYLKIDNARVAADMVTVRSGVDGIINKTYIDLKSQRVASGQPVVLLDDRDKKTTIDIIKASILEIESKISYNTQFYQIAIAQVDDNQKKFELDKELLNKELERLTIKSKMLAHTQQQIENLFNEHLVASNIRDSAVSDYRLSELDIEKQKVSIKKHAVVLRQLDTQSRKSELILHQINGDRNRKLKAQAEKKLLENELAKLMQNAPLSGIVDHIFVHDGEYVTAGQRLFMMHSQDSLRIEVNILETDLNKVGLGDEVDVILDYMPDKLLKGKVGRIASVTNDQLAFMPATQMASDFVKIKQRVVMDIYIDMQWENILPGMMATVIIPL